MKFTYSDGGRSYYFKASRVGDCVCRAICNATQKDYKEVYDRLRELEKKLKIGKHEIKGSVRDGVRPKVYEYYIEKELGWVREKVMGIGTGVQVHLTDTELPNGNLIIRCSHHLTCSRDREIYDTYDCSRDGHRAVYCYWREPTKEELRQREQEKISQQLKDEQKEKVNELIEEVKKEFKPSISKLEKRIKDLQHQLKLEQNRMNRKIEKIKKESF